MTALVQEVDPEPRCRIRSFSPGDRPAVREICAATGLLGDDVRCLFPKPDFFIDLFTSYYTDLEPESCLVAEVPGAEEQPEVVGYLLGCTNPVRYRHYQSRLLPQIACRVLRGLLQGEFQAAARSYLWWAVRHGWREMPRTPGFGAHFHFNFLKKWRNHNATLPLVETFLELLRREHPKLPVVWGQMSTYGRRRSAAVFQRYGWKFYDQVRLTKYAGISRAWEQAAARIKKDEAGRCPGNQKYARYQLPEIFLTTIYREL
jgi:hypothetical protein